MDNDEKTKSGNEDSGGDDEVGYCKPPKRTRFKPGQSGNPRGRPKGTNNLRTDLTEELAQKIVIREGDRSHKVSKQRAVVKTVVARTLKGDARSAVLLTSMMMRLLETGEGRPEIEEVFLDDEHEVLKAYEDRIRREGSRDQGKNEKTNEDNEEDES